MSVVLYSRKKWLDSPRLLLCNIIIDVLILDAFN